jgi:IS30 family transposase
MKKHKQLTLGQRYQIQSLLQAGLSQTKIASIIGVHRSTILRELRRNIPKRGRTANSYIAKHAQLKTYTRHVLKQRIVSLLEYEKWSLELISKRLSLNGEFCVSHETIYKWI